MIDIELSHPLDLEGLTNQSIFFDNSDKSKNSKFEG